MAISPSAGLSDDDRTTALFNGADMLATERLDVRHTAPERTSFEVPQTQAKPSPNKLFLIGVVLLLVLAAIASTVAVVKNRRQGHVASAESVLYPGSKKTMDVVAGGGGRAVSLETSDSFDKVRDWYQSTLKPEKVVQLTDNSVVMKSNTTTVTIVSDEKKTTILLKIIPQ